LGPRVVDAPDLGEQQTAADLRPHAGQVHRLEFRQHRRQGLLIAQLSEQAPVLSRHQHGGVGAGGLCAHRRSFVQRGAAVVVAARQQRSHSPPQGHVPQVERVTQRLRDGPVRQYFGVRGGDRPGHQHRHPTQPPAEQLQRRIAQPVSQRDDLGGVLTTLAAVIGSGHRVAQRGERDGHRAVVTSAARCLQGLLGEVKPSLGAFEQGQRDRQACRDQGGERTLRSGKSGPRPLQQVDLVPLE
jgi:hypothetical protein